MTTLPNEFKTASTDDYPRQESQAYQSFKKTFDSLRQAETNSSNSLANLDARLRRLEESDISWQNIERPETTCSMRKHSYNQSDLTSRSCASCCKRRCSSPRRCLVDSARKNSFRCRITLLYHLTERAPGRFENASSNDGLEIRVEMPANSREGSMPEGTRAQTPTSLAQETPHEIYARKQTISLFPYSISDCYGYWVCVSQPHFIYVPLPTSLTAELKCKCFFNNLDVKDSDIEFQKDQGCKSDHNYCGDCRSVSIEELDSISDRNKIMQERRRRY